LNAPDRAASPARAPAGRRSIPVRALAIGSLLLPVNAYWLVRVEMTAGGALRETAMNGPYPTNISLFANVIFGIVLLTLANAGVRRVAPRAALTQAELLLIYIMLSIGTCLTSIDFLDVLFSLAGHATRYASPENRWGALFVRYIPSWFHVSDPDAVAAYYLGHGSPYIAAHLRAWALPLAAWGVFILVLLCVMYCLTLIVRLPWTRYERLSYPILHLPMEVTDPGGALYRHRVFWIGFGLSGGLCLWNGLSLLFPIVPALPIKGTDLSQFFPNKPWSAMGWTPVAFYPFAIGMGFLLPTDMLFSTWFFCLMWRAQRIFASCFGLSDYSPNFPYVNEQAFGAYMAVAVIAVAGLRPHVRAMLAESRDPRSPVNQPIPLRAAIAGAVLGMVALCFFFYAAGLPLWACVLSFVIYFGIAIACARMRAELGPPAHDLHNGGPDYILTAVFGSRAFTPPELTVLTYFFWFNRAYRTIAMPYQLEAFKIGDRQQIAPSTISLTLGVSTVIGLLSGFWALYSTGYRKGAEIGMASHFTYFGWEAMGRLANWVQSPRPTDLPAALAIAAGLSATLILNLLRLRFLWWPLHPLGLAVSASFSLSTLWVPMLLAWIAKTTTLRYAGLRGYRAALPFFLGLTLGDFMMGMLWPIIGAVLGVNTYSFYF
jgi:hypothetical protein